MIELIWPSIAYDCLCARVKCNETGIVWDNGTGIFWGIDPSNKKKKPRISLKICELWQTFQLLIIFIDLGQILLDPILFLFQTKMKCFWYSFFYCERNK